MTDTQVHPEGGSRAEGPLRPTTAEWGTLQAHVVKLEADMNRLRRQNTELREALAAILNDSEDEFDGQARYRPERIAPARAALARSQQ